MTNHVILTSERLIYRPYKSDDIPYLVKLCSEKTFLRWFYFLPILDEKRAKEQVHENSSIWSREINIMKDNCTLAVVKKGTEELIGSVGVSKFHGIEMLKNIEVAFNIGELYQNKGYATEAVNTITNWGTAKLKKIGEPAIIVGKAEHENFASRRTLEKSGYICTDKELYCHVYNHVIS